MNLVLVRRINVKAEGDGWAVGAQFDAPHQVSLRLLPTQADAEALAASLQEQLNGGWSPPVTLD